MLIGILFSCVHLQPVVRVLEDTHVKIMKAMDPSYMTEQDQVDEAKKQLGMAYASLTKELDYGLTALTQEHAITLVDKCHHHLFRLKTGRLSSDLTVPPVQLSEYVDTPIGQKYIAEIEGECRDMSFSVYKTRAQGCYIHKIRVDYPLNEQNETSRPHYFYPSQDCSEAFFVDYDHSFLFSSPDSEAIPCREVPEFPSVPESAQSHYKKLKKSLCEDGLLGFHPDAFATEYKGCFGRTQKGEVYCFSWMGEERDYIDYEERPSAIEREIEKPERSKKTVYEDASR
jgi:hypothetical protein